MNPDFWKQFAGLLVLVGVSEVRLTARGRRELLPRFTQAGLELPAHLPLKIFLERHQTLLRHERAQELRSNHFRAVTRGPRSLDNERFLREHLPAEDQNLLKTKPVLVAKTAASTGGQPCDTPPQQAHRPASSAAAASAATRPRFELIRGGADKQT